MKVKLIFTILLFFTINIILINNSMASTISDFISGGDEFIKSSEKSNELVNDDEAKKTIKKEVKEASDTVYKVLFVIGMSATLIVGTILGIKFMIGGIEEQAKIKEALVPFIIACVVIFGSFTIWSIVVNIASKLS